MSTELQVQSAVERLVPQTLSFARTGGKVDQAQAFLELREITLTLLSLDPNAILHIIRIARDKTLAATVAEFDLATTLKAALTDLDLGPITQPIRSAASLGNANSALANLQADISTGFVESDNVDNAKTSIDAFLNSQVAVNVKSGGSAIVTKEEAKRQIREILPELTAAHSEMLRLLIQLEIIFQEFSATDLRVLVGNSVIERSRTEITRIQSFSDVSDLGSAAQSTQHLADLQAIKRLLTSYFEAPGSLDDRLTGDSSNSLRAKLVGTGTPAQLISTTIVRPLVTIESGSSVVAVTANGVATGIDLLGEGIESTPAELFGTADEGAGYDTTGGKNSFTLSVDQATPTVVTLTVGAAVPRATIISEINTAVGVTVAFADIFQGNAIIRLTSTTTGRDSHILTGADTANPVLGFADNVLVAGTDPTLDDVAHALTVASGNGEYEVEAIDDTTPTTTLVSETTGVIVAGILTDGAVADFLAAGVEGGDLVTITSGKNDGVSIPLSRVTTSQVFLENVIDDTIITYTIVKQNQKLELTSVDTSLASALIVGLGNANAALGFSGAETDVGNFPLVQIDQETPAPAVAVDVALSSVLPGDTIAITGVGTFTVVTLETLSGDPVMRVTPEVDAFSGSAEFVIKSLGAESFKAFIDDPVDLAKPLPGFINVALPVNGYDQDLRVLEDAVAQALNDPAKVPAAITLADDLVDLLDAITGLQSILVAYDATEVAAVVLIINSLAEHNFDRFLALLTEGFIERMLATTKDDFSFAAQLQSAARVVNTEDLDVKAG